MGLLIGICFAPAQPAPAQTRLTTGSAGTLRPDDREFRARLTDLLLGEPHKHDHAEGWRLCQDIGRPVVPMLWDLYQQQGADVGRRMVLMVATALAGGTAEDAVHETTKLEERVLAALLIALGPRRPATAANPWPRLVGKQRNPPVVLQIAAYLAASRFPAALSEHQLPLPSESDKSDPGVVAAAAAAGVAVEVGPWLPPAAPARHAELVRRGVLLGHCFEQAPDQALLHQADVLFRAEGEGQETRRCAGLLLGRAGGDLVEGLLRPRGTAPAMPRPAVPLLEALVATPAAAAAVRGWLGPVRNPMDDDPKRLLSAYVYSRSVADVLADQDRWLASPIARRPVALTLALRLLTGNEPLPTLPPVAPADLPEWFWVAWAAKQHPPRGVHGDDPVLEQAADLAFDNRLPRATARTVLEEALWRSDAHPGLPLWRACRDLVRDLLLTGSLPGVKYEPVAAQRYHAQGLGPEHPLFDVAVEYFDFTNKPGPPLPPECRLP